MGRRNGGYAIEAAAISVFLFLFAAGRLTVRWITQTGGHEPDVMREYESAVHLQEHAAIGAVVSADAVPLCMGGAILAGFHLFLDPFGMEQKAGKAVLTGGMNRFR